MTTLSLILLHGLGADGNDMQPIAQAIRAQLHHAHPDLQVRIHCPDAPVRPVTVNGAYLMRAWFDLYGLQADAPVDTDGIEQSRQRISQLLEAEHRAGVAWKHIIIGGFSQGGVIAMHCALHLDQRLGALLALSTWLPRSPYSSPSASACQTPVFMAHGIEDDLIPVQALRRTYDSLAKLGYNTLHHATYPMPHSICMEEIDDISAWLVQHLAR
ncbi:MAG: hypothetical protein B7Y40_01955 [Gammaproteobacteria bacterium 28-57-27]|nr:MAG: hypothetical protein B7Y40_01955 [Gammaproteobacteria bacterium 28-57-27]